MFALVTGQIEALQHKMACVLEENRGIIRCSTGIRLTGAGRIASGRRRPKKANPWPNCWARSSPLSNRKLS